MVILCTHITLAAIFVRCAITIAYENILAITPCMVFVIGQGACAAGIYALCSHLLPGYMTFSVPTAALALVVGDYIDILSYPWLWAILMTWQAWRIVIQGSQTMVARGIGTMATIWIVAVPSTINLLLWLLVLVCSYTIVCCIGALLLTGVYPWVIKKNYTTRWQKLATRMPCGSMQVVGRGLNKTLASLRPPVYMGVLCLMQLYREYLSPFGSMTVVSLSHFGIDLVNAMVSILAIGMWATNCHFTPRLCRCISTMIQLQPSIWAFVL